MDNIIMNRKNRLLFIIIYDNLYLKCTILSHDITVETASIIGDNFVKHLYASPIRGSNATNTSTPFVMNSPVVAYLYPRNTSATANIISVKTTSVLYLVSYMLYANDFIPTLSPYMMLRTLIAFLKVSH